MINRCSTMIWTASAVVLIGCNPVSTADPLTPIQNDVIKLEPPDATDTPNPSELPVDEPMVSNSTLQNLVDQVKAYLSERIAIPIEEIDLVEARAVVWPDASLGCPITVRKSIV